MKVKLIKLTKEYENQLGEMLEEWKLDQKINHTNHSPWAIFKNDYHDFDYYLDNLEVKDPINGKVPDSVFFLLDEERNILLGAVNIRHYLNDYLLQYGGHIGDGIRPSERRKGYATEMIRLALLECRKLGIKKVLMVCDKSNVASARSIIKNGGILENEFIDENGEIQQRYWITVDKELLRKELNCTIYPLNSLKNYKYTVICSYYKDKWVLSRHQKRDTYETQGGLIEEGETPLESAKRELYEESGITDATIYPVCDYCGYNHISSANGQVFLAIVHSLGDLPQKEMSGIKLFKKLPENLTYPNVSPHFYTESDKLLCKILPLSIYIPTVEEMVFRQELLADKETMSYNAKWGGTIAFPKENWEITHKRLINDDNDSFYAYVYSTELKCFVGEIGYRYDKEVNEYIINILIHAKYRNKGFGTLALKLLCDVAKGKGINAVADTIALDNLGISIFLKQGFKEIYRNDNHILVKKDL